MDVPTILDKVVSHAMATGLFDRVNTYEPKSAPGSGLTAAIWVERIAPQPGGSGLASTTGRLELSVRLYTNMLQDPQEAIDPNLLSATDTLFTAYSGDFSLDGAVRNVDLLGMNGIGLSARAGYIRQDSALFRVMDISLPLVINDLWTQAE